MIVKTIKIIHNIFKAGIFLKGINGFLEIIGGLLLIFLSPAHLNKIVYILTESELSEDANDKVANFLIHAVSHFSVSMQLFGVFYLLSHGLIKILLVYYLWQGKRAIYPIAVSFLTAFVIYQLYRYTHTHSLWLLCLSIFDMFIICLAIIDYKYVKNIKN